MEETIRDYTNLLFPIPYSLKKLISYSLLTSNHVSLDLYFASIPNSAPANVSISPNAVRTDASMTPVGGAKNPPVIRITPNMTSSVASRI